MNVVTRRPPQSDDDEGYQNVIKFAVNSGYSNKHPLCRAEPFT
jgi:hypothetical protein